MASTNLGIYDNDNDRYLTTDLKWADLIYSDRGVFQEEAMSVFDRKLILRARIELSRLYRQQQEEQPISFSHGTSNEVAEICHCVMEQHEDWGRYIKICNAPIQIVGFIGLHEIPMSDDLDDYTVLVGRTQHQVEKCFQWLGIDDRAAVLPLGDVRTFPNIMVTCAVAPTHGWRQPRFWPILSEIQSYTPFDIDDTSPRKLTDILNATD